MKWNHTHTNMFFFFHSLPLSITLTIIVKEIDENGYEGKEIIKLKDIACWETMIV